MPSTSAKQAKFMRAVAHNPAFAKAAGVPQSVGQEFEAADESQAVVKQKRSKQRLVEALARR